MSQKDDSENDIWDYKPLEKKKKTRDSAPAVVKRRCTFRKTSNKRVKSPDRRVQAAERGEFSPGVHIAGHSSLNASDTVQNKKTAEEPFSGDFCPVCQMPFSILVVQTQRWHVAECLDTSRDKCQGTDIHIISSFTLNLTAVFDTKL